MTRCELGYEEHDAARYCFRHGGFAHYLMNGHSLCHRSPHYQEMNQ